MEDIRKHLQTLKVHAEERDVSAEDLTELFKMDLRDDVDSTTRTLSVSVQSKCAHAVRALKTNLKKHDFICSDTSAKGTDACGVEEVLLHRCTFTTPKNDKWSMDVQFDVTLTDKKVVVFLAAGPVSQIRQPLYENDRASFAKGTTVNIEPDFAIRAMSALVHAR